MEQFMLSTSLRADWAGDDRRAAAVAMDASERARIRIAASQGAGIMSEKPELFGKLLY